MGIFALGGKSNKAVFCFELQNFLKAIPAHKEIKHYNDLDLFHVMMKSEEYSFSKPTVKDVIVCLGVSGVQ